MKKQIYIGSFFLILVFLFSGLTVFSQSNSVKGRITHEEKVSKGIKNSLIDAEEKYDQKGNVIEEINYKEGKFDKKMVYEYDANNNKTKETEYDASGKAQKYGEYKYENGLRKEKFVYDQDRKLIEKKTYTYIY